MGVGGVMKQDVQAYEAFGEDARNQKAAVPARQYCFFSHAKLKIPWLRVMLVEPDALRSSTRTRTARIDGDWKSTQRYRMMALFR